MYRALAALPLIACLSLFAWAEDAAEPTLVRPVSFDPSFLADASPAEPVLVEEPAGCDCCAAEDFWSHRRDMADKHVPAGLMGDHIHEPGEWMFEYKYMNMYMDGNRVGTRSVTDQQALTEGQALGTNNGATPTEMTMEMHMIHIMYGWTEDVTLYTMIMFNSLTMDHLRNNGTTFTTHNSGIADTAFGALWRVYHRPDRELNLNLGFSVPTGEISTRTTEPSGGLVEQELPYPMRRGSGTFNARPGITYKRYLCHGSYGVQLQTDLPIGRNWDDYTVSDEFRLNFWYAHLLRDRLAVSFRVENLWETNFEGADPELNPAAISTARPDMRGGYWLNFGYGAMLLIGDGHLLNVEAIHPVYQDLDGIQLETDFQIVASWSKAF